MSSFFGRVFAGKAAAASADSTTLNTATVEQIVAELQHRGFTVHVDGHNITLTSPAGEVTSVAAAESVESRVYKVLQVMAEWEKSERHRNDKDRTFKSLWSEIKAFDWARTPRGYCCDANKSVKVGVSEYSKWEDPESAQVLLIQHYDSERPGNYEKRNSWGQVPPVWAIAFSCEELKELSKDIIANAAKEGTLIHREPQDDEFDYSSEPWWSESHWLVEDGKLTGVRILSKCTQDTVPKTQLIRFKMRGTVFEMIGVETPPQPVAALANVAATLPTPEAAILPPPMSKDAKTLPAGLLDAEGNPKVEGESVLAIRVCKDMPATRNFDGRDKSICQAISTPVYAITNPTDTRIAITEFWVDILQSGELGSGEENWVRCPTRVGVQTSNYYGQTYTEYVDVHTFEVASHASVELVLEGTWTKENANRPAYNGRPHNQRIHELFPDPLIARGTFKDDQENTKTVYFGAVNTPLENVWSTYEEAIVASSSNTGYGEEYQVEMWLCVENPITLDKCIILVTTKKDSPHEWFVRVQDDRRDLGGSYNEVGPLYFQKMAFKASIATGDKPAEIDVDLGGTSTCKLTGLMDYETKTIYALHGVVHIVHDGETIAKAEAYAKLDYARVTQE